MPRCKDPNSEEGRPSGSQTHVHQEIRRFDAKRMTGREETGSCQLRRELASYPASPRWKHETDVGFLVQRPSISRCQEAAYKIG